MILRLETKTAVAALHGALILALILVLAPTRGSAEVPVIPDLDVTGPSADFDMGTRLMTSGKRMEVKLTVPGKGSVKMPKFNGTFFYSPANPEATTGTLLFRADQFQDIKGKMSKELIAAFDFDAHPFFAFQSRSATATQDGIDLVGQMIVKDRKTDAVLRLESPGKVAENAKGERWIKFRAGMNVSTAELGLTALGSELQFELDMFLFNYTVDSARQTGIRTGALDKSPPRLPTDASGLSNSGWYLMLTGRYAEAIEAFDASIQENPQNISAYLRRGDAYVFNGDYGKAVGTYKLTSSVMPAHPHMIELIKVLNEEYLTPSSLQEANKMWTASQAGKR